MSILKVYKIFGREFQILRLAKGSPIRHNAPINEIDDGLRKGVSKILRIWPSRWAIAPITWTGKHHDVDAALMAALRSMHSCDPKNGKPACGDPRVMKYNVCQLCTTYSPIQS